jgi:hypothetical protein
MSNVITSGSAARLLQDGVKKVWHAASKEWEPIYTQLYKMDSSTKQYELTVQMENMGLASVKTEGDDITFDSFRQSFAPKFVHVAYGKGFIVTREAKDDNQYGYYKKGARALNRAMNITKEVRTHVLYNTAFSTSSAMTGGDGIAMCSTAHINGPSGGTYSNRLAVDAEFSEAALEDMLKQIMRAKDDRGLAIKLRAMKLIGHTNNKFEFDRVLNSSLRSGTADNDKNVLMGTIANGVVVSPYLDANTKAWFIMTDAEEGMTYYDRVPLEFDEDKAFTSDNSRYKAYMRFSTGYSDPRGIYGSNPT